MIQFLLLINRQGVVRLKAFYGTYSEKDQVQILREVHQLVSSRPSAHSNFINFRDTVIVYKRFASLFAVACIDKTDNELITLEVLRRYIENLDSYFGSVCELDIVFSFEKALFVLHETVIAGELAESSTDVAKEVTAQDAVAEEGGITAPTVTAVRQLPDQKTAFDSWTDASSLAANPDVATADPQPPERTRFDCEAQIEGHREKAYLQLTIDSLELRNLHDVVERSWSYSIIGRWAHTETAFAVDTGRRASGVTYTVFYSQEGKAIADALASAIRKYKRAQGR